MQHPLLPDETTILKSASLKFDENKTIIGIFTYHCCAEEPKDSRFYRCDVSMRENAEWEKMAEDLMVNPAEPFRWSMVGIDMDYRLWYSRRQFVKSDFSKWLRRMLSEKRLRDVSEFMFTEFAGEMNLQWFRKPYFFSGDDNEYDFADLRSLDTHLGRWMTCVKRTAPRTNAKRI